MKNHSLFSSSIVVMLIVFIANPAYADMTLFVSGDSNIINPLFGDYPTSWEDEGNKQFFNNVLQTGDKVAVLEGTHSDIFASEINEYYDSLLGVESSMIPGTVFSDDLIEFA